MKIWASANQKGGVGKTTTVVCLGGLLAEAGHPTLLVDLDPHGSLTGYLGRDPEGAEGGAYALFQAAAQGRAADAGASIVETGCTGLSLLPARTALATLDRQLGTREGMGLVIARALAGVASRFEFVLIDCPPMLGILMVNALAACERVLIPVQTEYLALHGLDRMVRTLEMVTRARPQPLPALIVPTLFDRRTRASPESLRRLRERYPEQAWRSTIPVDTRFREASRAGVPPSVAYPRARGVEAYRLLLGDLLDGPVPDRAVVVPGGVGTDSASIASQSTRSAAPEMGRQNSGETVSAAGESSHGNGGCK
ncbi:sporulation initiation inhibitor protein Soj [bacterium BMS3Bbin12]|nr:sporulation initiation inhibitor protein Soj [bacterium BMS3Bbin12]GBE49895.1 sporulation initiation inhibitor protein Soj [bacterium BMS3Bbin13]HDJ86759.1 ParA family protein [Chromatiales bacterium]HDK03380.1 ParA family protein [Gammaproteobacteria bacterium]